MNDSERRKQEAFVRSHDFGAAHATEFAQGSLGTQHFNGLGATVTEIAGLAASEASAFWRGAPGHNHSGASPRRIVG